MIIPRIDPVQLAVTELVYPEVKSLTDTILKKNENTFSSVETLPAENIQETVMQEMIHITTFEMMKNEIFFPEHDEEEEW